MDPTFSLLLSSTKNLSLVNKYVFGDDIKKTIRSLAGDDSVDAALLAISTNSVHPEGRIASAINHLEYAHVSYTRMINSIKDKADYISRIYDIQVSMQKDYLTCALITLCHCALKDYLAAKESLEWGRETMYNSRVSDIIYNRSRLFSIPLELKFFLSTPMGVAQITRGAIAQKKGKVPGISCYDYLKFYDAIVSLIRK
jgi:hypothetical protein